MLLLCCVALLAACTPVPRTVRVSTPQGDLAVDTRDPTEVCVQLQYERKMQDCTLKEAKASTSEKECVDGMSIAGCFACTLTCPR